MQDILSFRSPHVAYCVMRKYSAHEAQPKTSSSRANEKSNWEPVRKALRARTAKEKLNN